jgi:drug/metabolite transporter (DMT)-like permease
VWGSTYLAIRVAVETMPPFLMAAARFLLAGAALITFLKLRGAPWPSARQWRLNALIGTLLLLGGNGTVVWAEQFVPSGLTALLIGIGPLFIVLIEWAWPGGQRPTARTALALLIGFFGVTWLAAPWQNPTHGGLHVGGVIAILAGCFFWSLGSITSRHAKHGADPMMASALQLLCGGTALMVAACIHGDWTALNLPAISARSWGAFFYLVVVGSIVGFSTFVWLMKKCPPAQVATFAYVNPVVAVILGWLILGEPITARTLVASALIITAVVLITLEKNKPAR